MTPALVPLDDRPGTHYQLYRVVGGPKDGWYVSKRWKGAQPAKHTRPMRSEPQAALWRLKYDLGFEALAELIADKGE